MIKSRLSTLVLAIALLSWSSQVLAADLSRMNQFIDDLMGKMTLQEKIGQLNLPVTGDIITGSSVSGDVVSKIKAGQVGGLFNMKGVQSIRALQEVAVKQSRLGIPLIFGMDVIHGYETVFPIPFAMSMSWDMDAIRNAARISSVEATADGICWTFSPMVTWVAQSPKYTRSLHH